MRRLLLAILLAGCSTGSPLKQPYDALHATARIDHVVVGVPNLDAAIESFEKLSGVRAVHGGSHPRMGTHNALVSLGSRAYLELIARRADAEVTPFDKELSGLAAPTPLAWAVAFDGADSAAHALRSAGFKPSAIEPGSRQTPAGTTLRWRVFGLEDGIAHAPFFIEWAADSPHPSATSPAGCTLKRLKLDSPDAARLEQLIQRLGVKVDVLASKAPQISVDLVCPRGPVSLPAR